MGSPLAQTHAGSGSLHVGGLYSRSWAGLLNPVLPGLFGRLQRGQEGVHYDYFSALGDQN